MNTAPTFRVNRGRALTDIAATDDHGGDVVVLPDGKIVMVGTTIVSPGSPGRALSLVRYDANGNLDTSFSGDGRASTPVANWEGDTYGLALAPDGKILVAGSVSDSS